MDLPASGADKTHLCPHAGGCVQEIRVQTRRRWIWKRLESRWNALHHVNRSGSTMCRAARSYDSIRVCLASVGSGGRLEPTIAARSMYGSPIRAASQSMTIGSPPSRKMRFEGRKSPWISRGAIGSGSVATRSSTLCISSGVGRSSVEYAERYSSNGCRSGQLGRSSEARWRRPSAAPIRVPMSGVHDKTGRVRCSIHSMASSDVPSSVNASGRGTGTPSDRARERASNSRLASSRLRTLMTATRPFWVFTTSPGRPALLSARVEAAP
jgi:hypothetical protein